MIPVETPAEARRAMARTVRLPLPPPIRFVVAVASAALLTAGAALLIPSQLKVATDIVGYPIYAAFNVDRLINIYFLAVLLFPVAAIVFYLGLGWFAGGADWERLARPRPAALVDDADADRTPAWARVATAARVLAVGAVLGLEVAIILDAAAQGAWLLLVGTAAIYAALVGAAALATGPYAGERVDLDGLAARSNATAAPLVVLGLGGVSAVTQVIVRADGSVHHYSWLPWWLAGAATVGLISWIGWRVSSASTTRSVRAIERNTLLFLVAPVAVFLLLATVPAALTIEVFHDGEHLVAATLTGQGWFPWRDLFSIHGLFDDSLSGLAGLRLFGDNYRGYATAQSLFIAPLLAVTLLALITWLVRRNWTLVLIFSLIILGGRFDPFVGARFIIWPLMLLLLAAVIDRPHRWLSAVFGAGLAVQAVLIPEMAYALPACGIVLILSDLSARQPGARLIVTLRRTLWALAGGAAVAAVLLVILLSQRALSDFLFYYIVFAPGHALAGALPLDVRRWNTPYAFLVVSPIVAILLAWWYYAAKVIRRIPINTADWVIAAASIFALIYYTKYLARADFGHIAESYYVALPLIAFLIFRAVTLVDGMVVGALQGLRVRGLTARPLSIALLALVLFISARGGLGDQPFPERLTSAAAQYRAEVPTGPVISKLGPGAGGVDLATYQDLTRVLNAYLRPGDWVFDFSNEPALYYYLLGYRPHTRYYDVSMAIPEVAQKDLIAQLKRDPPRLVVFTNFLYGQPAWDGVQNMIRHYDVAQYILDHYRPLLSTHTQLLFGQTSANLSAATAAALPLNEPVLTDNLYFRSSPCDWGYAPNFLSISPPPPLQPLSPVKLAVPASAPRVSVSGWAADPQSGLPAQEVIAVVNGRAAGIVRPSVERPDVVDFLGMPDVLKSGFGFGELAAGTPRLFGVNARGVASELDYGAGVRPRIETTPLERIQLPDGSTVPVEPGAVTGYVDSMSLAYTAAITAPQGVTWSSYRWLEITPRSGFQPDTWVLSDGAADPNHRIDFRTESGSQSPLRVYVGSCVQWHGYEGQTLYLRYSTKQDIAMIRLLP